VRRSGASDTGDETLADIGRSYNVSPATISRLMAQGTTSNQRSGSVPEARRVDRVGLDLMLAFLAPHDQPDARGGSVAERHRRAGFGFHFQLCREPNQFASPTEAISRLEPARCNRLRHRLSWLTLLHKTTATY
jgi:hypothetical protein